MDTPFSSQNIEKENLVPINYTPSEENLEAGAIPVSYTPNEIIPSENINDNYEKYNNISEVHNSGIKQPKKNKFYISTGCHFLYMLIFTFIVGFLAIFLSILCIIYGEPEPGTFLGPIAGIMLMYYSIKLRCKTYNNIYIILGNNTLTVIKSSGIQQEEKVYKSGELKEVKFISIIDKFYSYKLDFVLNENNTENILNIDRNSSQLYTQEEINYFLYVVNKHIQTNMMI